MRRALPVLVALALVAVGLALWWKGGGRTAPEVGASEEESAPAPREPPEPALAEPERDDDPARQPVETAAAGGSDEAASSDVVATEPEPERTGVPVLVVTPEGEPVAGVVVDLLRRVADQPDEGTHLSATTDARGRALLVEGDEERTWRERIRQALEVDVTFRVEARLLTAERPSRELGVDPWLPASSPPVRLVLPAAGSVRVHVTTPEGDPPPARCQVFPQWRPMGSEERYGRLGAPRADVVDGVATLPVVPLGLDLELNVSGSGYRSAQAYVAGPTRAGEVVETSVVLGPPLATVTGVLVGEDGAPLTGVSVSMALVALDRDAPADAEPERVSWLWAPLDDQGRFTRSTSLEPDATQRLAVLVHEVARHTPSAVDRFARWDGEVELPPGEVLDVGTLVLRPHQDRRLLVAGRVTAVGGERLRNPGVDVGYWDRETRQWTRLPEERVEVQSDGTFEAHTILADVPARFTVSAGARGYLGASVEASLGERGIELVLERGGGLAGRLVADDPAALPLLAVVIESEGVRREPDIAFGRFGIDGLPPGTYSVTGKAHGTDWLFGGIEGVAVPRGGRAVDPRLERIDLGDACRVLRLVVVGPDGEPLADENVWLDDREGDGGAFRTGDDGRLVALVPAAAPELGLRAWRGDERLGAIWSQASGYEGTITLAVDR